MKSRCWRSSVLPLMHNTHTLTLHFLPHSKWTWGLSTTNVKKKRVWKDVLHLFNFVFVFFYACIRTHAQTQTEKSKSKKAKAQTGILPLRGNIRYSMRKCQSNMLLSIICNIFDLFWMTIEEDSHKMKGNDTEANRRDEQRGGQKGMNHDEWFLFACPRVRWEAVLCGGTGLLPGCAWISGWFLPAWLAAVPLHQFSCPGRGTLLPAQDLRKHSWV